MEKFQFFLILQVLRNGSDKHW